VRVLYFSRDYTPHDHRFLASLADSHHHTYYLRLECRGTVLEERPLPHGIKQITWQGGNKPIPRREYASIVIEIKRLIDNVKPELVHAGPLQSAAYLTAMAGYHPLVSMSWGSDLLIDSDRSRWLKRATELTLSRTDILLGDCQAVKKKVIQDYGYPLDRIVTFPWGIDLEKFSASSVVNKQSGEVFRRKLGWDKNFVLLSMRSWEPVYGVDVVARGFVQAVYKNPNLRLLLLGDGSQAGVIRQILKDPLVIDKVYFAGQVRYHDLPGYFHTADLYISASHSDGSSVTLMEALASGLPVVVSDIPGNREWISTGKEGWLFTDGSAEELAEKVLYAAEGGADLLIMGQAARRHAEQCADWKKNFQQLLKAYEMAVSLHGG
jgi:glycosyltransferase involved in cell wall biosynthesis